MAKDTMEESAKVSIEDFVSTHKVVAFCQSYTPCDAEGDGVEVFNDARLRKYFQAFPRNIGDPLNVYLDMLQRNGFTMRTSIQGEPAVFCRRKTEAHQRALLEDAFGDYETQESLLDGDFSSETTEEDYERSKHNNQRSEV